MVTEALGALYLGLDAAATELDHWHDKSIQKDAQFGAGGVLSGKFGSDAANAIQTFRELADKDLEVGRQSEATAKMARQAYSGLRGAYGEGVIGAGGKVNIESAKDAYAAMDLATRQTQLAGLGLDAKKAFYNTDEERKDFAERLAQVIGQLIQQGAGTTADGTSHRKTSKPPITNINIANLQITQDFKDAQPDRVFHNVPRDILDMVRNAKGSNLQAGGG